MKGNSSPLVATASLPGSTLAGLTGVPSLEEIERSVRDRAVAARRRWLRTRPLVMLVVGVFIEIVLWRAGYPRWRVAGVGAALVALLALKPFWRFDLDGLCCSDRARVDPIVLARLGIGLFMAGVTGGLSSPLLISPLGAFFGLAIQYGAGRTTKAALGLLALGVLAMSVLPEQWLGPMVPRPAFTALAGATFVAMAAITTDFIAFITRTVEASRSELGRAREQAMAHLHARARELEQVGAQLSHELKNPLQAIKILVQLTAREASDSHLRDRLKVAESEVERMQDILKEYLSFSRPLEKLRPEQVALGALVDEVTAALGARASASGVLLQRRGEARVEADARRLKEAFFNLVSNAIEASPSGGHVAVEIGLLDDSAQVLVRDSGRGMSKEVLERIGRPFFTTREEGTGLGVVLARNAFAQHGGSLEYDSAPGQGTLATVRLPLRPATG